MIPEYRHNTDGDTATDQFYSIQIFRSQIQLDQFVTDGCGREYAQIGEQQFDVFGWCVVDERMLLAQTIAGAQFRR